MSDRLLEELTPEELTAEAALLTEEDLVADWEVVKPPVRVPSDFWFLFIFIRIIKVL